MVDYIFASAFNVDFAYVVFSFFEGVLDQKFVEGTIFGGVTENWLLLFHGQTNQVVELH